MALTFEERLARIADAPNATAAPLPGDISNQTAKAVHKYRKPTHRRRGKRRLAVMPVVMTGMLLAGLAAFSNPDLLNAANTDLQLMQFLSTK